MDQAQSSETCTGHSQQKLIIRNSRRSDRAGLPGSAVRSQSNPSSMSLCGLSPQGPPLRCDGKRPAAATYREALGRCPWLLPAHVEGRAANQDSRHSGAIFSGCSSPASPWSTVVGRPNRRLAPLQAAGMYSTHSDTLLVLLYFADCVALAGSAAAQQPVSKASP